MRVISVLVATATLLGASSAMAQNASDWAGFHGSVQAGASAGKDHGSSVYNPEGPRQQGAMLGITLGDRFVVADHIVVGVEIGGHVGRVEDKSTSLSCAKADCGADEYLTETNGYRYSANVGLSVGHPVGPALVSVTGGLRVTDVRHGYSYNSKGYFPDYAYTDQGYRAGYYYGLRGEYPLSDSWTAQVEWRHSDLIEAKTHGTDWSSNTKFKDDTITVGLGRAF